MRIDARGSRLRPGIMGLGLGVAACLAPAMLGHADGKAQIDIDLMPPSELIEGDPAEAIAHVRVHPKSDLPLLLTPSSEGKAVEVVRGRLLRSDAEDPRAETLRFRIPLIARSPGSAAFRIEVVAHLCRSRCETLREKASVVLRVAPRSR